jgi:hypothetical protein
MVFSLLEDRDKDLEDFSWWSGVGLVKGSGIVGSGGGIYRKVTGHRGVKWKRTCLEWGRRACDWGTEVW